jgi:hypothetical protein
VKGAFFRKKAKETVDKWRWMGYNKVSSIQPYKGSVMTKMEFIPSGRNVSHPSYQGEASEEIKIENTAFIINDEELVRWMTEGTNPHGSPRSDCG